MADANDVQARVKAALDFLLQQSQNVVRSVDGHAPDANGNVQVEVGDAYESDILEAADKALETVTNVGGTDIADVMSSVATVEARLGEIEPLKSVDGVLQWDGKNVERVNSIGTNHLRFESGLQICWWVGVSGVTYTFQAAFAYAPVVLASPYGSGTVQTAQILNFSTTTATPYCTESSWAIFCFAIGKWK